MTAVAASHFIRTFSAEIYNNLATVGVADRRLRDVPNRESAFQEIGSLICSHELEECVGLALLHRHNRVADDQLMVEFYDETTYGGPALFMQRTDARIVPERVPVVLKVHGDGDGPQLVAMEHSTVAPAADAYEKLAPRMGEFVPGFAAMLRKHRLANLVGLSIVRQSILAREPGEDLIEKTDDERVANVVRAERRDPAASARYVVTNWQFTPMRKLSTTAACKSYCESVACWNKTICESEQASGGKHEKVQIHDKEHKDGHIKS